MIKGALVTMAEAFGFEGCYFASHSLRIGGYTSARTAGSDKEMLKKIGGWSLESNVEEIYNVGTTQSTGALGVLDSDVCSKVMTYLEVQAMMPPGWQPNSSTIVRSMVTHT